MKRLSRDEARRIAANIAKAAEAARQEVSACRCRMSWCRGLAQSAAQQQNIMTAILEICEWHRRLLEHPSYLLLGMPMPIQRA
jgi:hypothetical protein